MSKNKKDRRTFYVKSKDNTDDIEVTAGGVILYRIKNNELQLLLMTNRGKYEDLGGTSESQDKSIYETVAREISEESNGLINKESILKRIKKSDYIISKTAKYIIFIIKATKKESELTSKQFGNKEIHDNIERTIDWVPVSEFLNSDVIKNKINFRLKNRNIFEYLKKIDPNKKDINWINSSKLNEIYLF